MASHLGPWGDRGDENPTPSAVSTPPSLPDQQQIPPSSLPSPTYDGLTYSEDYCMSPEDITSHPSHVSSQRDDLRTFENLSTPLPIASSSDEITSAEQSQTRRGVSSVPRQAFEVPSTPERPRLRRRQTEYGDQASSPIEASTRWSKKRIKFRDLSQSTQNELKNHLGISDGDERALPPILEVGREPVARNTILSDEGYYSKQNSGHTCLEALLNPPFDQSTLHTCDIDGISFNRASDLERHRHVVHPTEHPSRWIYPCPVPGCHRQRLRPFVRRDKCMAHLRQCHPSNRLPIQQLANSDMDNATSSCARDTHTETIQSPIRSHYESYSTTSDRIEKNHRNSDPALDDNTVLSDTETSTSESFCSPDFLSSDRSTKPQAPLIGHNLIEESLRYRSQDKQSQIDRYVNDNTSDPASLRFVVLPAHRLGPGENLPFSSRTLIETTSSRGKKHIGQLGTQTQQSPERRQKRRRASSSQGSPYPPLMPRVESTSQPIQEHTNSYQQGQATYGEDSENYHASTSFQDDEFLFVGTSNQFNYPAPETGASTSFNDLSLHRQDQPPRRRWPDTQHLPTLTTDRPMRDQQGYRNMRSPTGPSYSQPIGSNNGDTATTSTDYRIHTTQQGTSTVADYTVEDSNRTQFTANTVLMPPQIPSHFAMQPAPSYHSPTLPSSSPTHYRRPSPRSQHRRIPLRPQQALDPPMRQPRTHPQHLQQAPTILSHHTYDQYPTNYFPDNTIDPSLLTPSPGAAYQTSTGTPYTVPSLTRARSPSTIHSDLASQPPPEPAYHPPDNYPYGPEYKPEADVVGTGQKFSEEDLDPWALGLYGASSRALG